MDVVDLLKTARDRSSGDSRHVLSGSPFSQCPYDLLIPPVSSWTVWCWQKLFTSSSGRVLREKRLGCCVYPSGCVSFFLTYCQRCSFRRSAVNLVNSSTPYSYDLRSQTYVQPQFAYQTLQRTLSVNNSILSSLTTAKKLFFEKREVPAGSTLVDLINIGLKDVSSAPAVLDALISELGRQKT